MFIQKCLSIVPYVCYEGLYIYKINTESLDHL